MVTNNVNVISFAIKVIENRVFELDAEVIKQKEVINCLSKKEDKVEVMARVALVLGVARTILSATGSGLGLNASGITFKMIGEKIGRFLQREFSKIHMCKRAAGSWYYSVL